MGARPGSRHLWLNRGVLAILDGAVVPAEEATVPATDEGLLRGDGVFEVVRLYGGRPVRARRAPRADGALGGATCGCRSTSTRSAPTSRALLAAAEPGDARCCAWSSRAAAAASRSSSRSPSTRRPSRWPASTLRADAHARRRSSRCPTARTCSRRASRRSRAPTRRCSSRRTAACSRRRRQSFFCVVRRRRRSCTPPLGDHILDSITRRRVIELDARRRAAGARSTSCSRAPTRRSWPRRRARCSPSAPIDGVALPQAPGPLTRARRRPLARASIARAVAPAIALSDGPHRHREPAAVRQGRGGLAPAARARTRRCSSTPGQHYDDELSTVFFDELGVPRARARARHRPAARTPSRPRACSPRWSRCSATSGPTPCSSTATRTRRSPAALAAAQARIPVAHVEAGMRSFDRAMPEELNRVLTDHLSRRCCCARRRRAVDEPRARGRRRRASSSSATSWSTSRCSSSRGRASDDGAARAPPACEPGEYLLATAHRAGNVDDPARLRAARRPAARACRCRPCCRCTRARGRGWRRRAARRARGGASTCALQPPLGYLDVHRAARARARAVLTDSGGVQKEAYLAGVPCVTLRDTTEWVETVDGGLERARRPRPRRGAAPRSSAGRAERAPRALRRRATPASASSPRSSGPRGELAGPPRRRTATPAAANGSRVEHAAAVDDDARAGHVGRRPARAYAAWSACTIAPSTAPPSHGSKPSAAQLVVVVERVGGDGARAAARASASRSAKAPENAVSFTPPR